MNFAALLVVRLEQVVGFSNKVLMDAPRLREFFEVLDTVPAVRDRPDAIDPGRLRGMVEFSDVSFSYDGKRPAVVDLSFTALPGETVAMVGTTGAGKSTALALLHRAFDPQSGVVKIDLQFEPRWRQARLQQDRVHQAGQVALLELSRRKVDRNLQRARPRCRLGAGLAQHPLAD